MPGLWHFCSRIMGVKEEKFNRRRLRMAYISSVMSITLVLFTLGMVGALLVTADNLGQYIRENLVIQVMFNETTTDLDAVAAANFMETLPAVRSVRIISPEEAKQEFIKEYGVDFTGVIDNPLHYNLEIKIKAGYLNPDSLLVLEGRIMQAYGDQVFEIHKDDALISEVNNNLQKAGWIMLGVSLLLALIMVALINNTIRLAIYSRRFLIKTMQLVGASGAFIRKPFVKSGVMQGFIGSIFASLLLLAVILFAQHSISDFPVLPDTLTMAVLFAGMLLTGTLFTWIFTWFAVRKFLRLKADELY